MIGTILVLIAITAIAIALLIACAIQPPKEIRIPIPQTVVVVVTATQPSVEATQPVAAIPTETNIPSATLAIGNILVGNDVCRIQRVKAILDTFIFSEASTESTTHPLRKGEEVQVVGAYDRNNEVWLAVIGTDLGFVQQTQVTTFQCIPPI